MTVKVIPMATELGDTDTITASSENPNFPVENVLDEHPKKKWIAAATNDHKTVEFFFDVGGIYSGATALYVGDTNADSLDIELYNSSSTKVLDTTIYPTGFGYGDPTDGGLAVTKSGNNSYWYEFGVTVAGDHTLNIEFNGVGASEYTECGVIVIGSFVEFETIQAPVEIEMVDYSIKKQLSSGAWYVKERDAAIRAVSTLSLQRSEELSLFMTTINQVRPGSAAWQLYYDEDGSDVDVMTIYGLVEESPAISNISKDRATAEITLIETI